MIKRVNRHRAHISRVRNLIHALHLHRWQLLVMIVLVVAAALTIAAIQLMHRDSIRDAVEPGVYKHVAYCDTKDPEQVLELIVPQSGSETAKPVPLIVYVHGGGWRAGKQGNALIRYYMTQFLAKGIAVADVGYRLDAPHPYPDQNNDVACALHYLATNQSTYNIDTSRTVLFGDSAGGQLVAAAALGSASAKYSYPKPRGVIDFYGVSDFSTIVNAKRPDLNARYYLGKRYLKEAEAASPLTMVTADAPPFFITHGDRDGVVPAAQSRELYQKLVAYNVSAVLYIVPGARHGFVGPELPTAQRKRLSDGLDSFLMRTLDL